MEYGSTPQNVSDQQNTVDDSSKRVMFKAAMSGNWAAVKQQFLKNPGSREAKITRSEDTVLHFAVIEGHIADVKDLVNLLQGNDEREKILLAENNRGNTPLHLAAVLGDGELCDFLATLRPEEPNVVSKALEARNEDGETPLFLAALHGKKDAFLVLLGKTRKKPISHYHSRNDGNTILHVALMGDHFDLAFQIIQIYRAKQPESMNRLNEKGQSALHILATRSHAFRSGYHLGTIERMLYYLTWVDPLTVDESIIRSNTGFHYHSTRSEHDNKPIFFPENYSTCVDVFKLAVLKPFKTNEVQAVKERTKRDAENPPASSNSDGGKVVDAVGTRREKKSRTINIGPHRLIPPNYVPLFQFLEMILKFTQTLLGIIGLWKLKKIKDRKQRHTWAVQVMEELVKGASLWEYDERPIFASALPDFPKLAPDFDDREFGGMLDPIMEIPTAQRTGQLLNRNLKQGGEDEVETSILVAAKHGVVEMVEKILKVFPVAIQDENRDGKNVVLLAVEHRRPLVYQLLLNKYMKESVFQKTDNKGNSALHLAAILGGNRPWIIPGAALQMQWEIKWYKFVKSSMKPHFFARLNDEGRTAKEIFIESHRDLLKEGGVWLNSTSNSCSVVAAVIASVAFAAAASAPGGGGGVIEDKGAPILEGRQAFDLFAINSLVALCLSVTSLIIFLSILTTSHEAKDFEWSLPRKLMIGLSCLFISIVAILVPFSTGHYFALRNHLKYVAFFSLPVAVISFAQFPLYSDILRAMLTPVPHRNYKGTVN